MSVRKFAVLLVFLCFTITLTGCNFRVGYVETNMPAKWSASYWYFNENMSRGITTGQGQTITIDYEIEVDKGELIVQLLDPEGELLVGWDRESANQPENIGITVTADEVIVPVSEGGKYLLTVSGNKTKGSFSFTWTVR